MPVTRFGVDGDPPLRGQADGRQRWGINSFLVGWFDEPELRDLAPVIEQLAGE